MSPRKTPPQVPTGDTLGRVGGNADPPRSSLACRALLVLTLSTLTIAARVDGATLRISSTAELETAIQSAASGDTLALAAGSYAPTATLTVTRPLVLTGPASGPGARINGSAIGSEANPDLFVVSETGAATIQSITFTQTGPAGVAMSNFGRLTLLNSALAGNSGPALVAQTGSRTDLANSSVLDNADVGIVAQPGARVSLTHTTIANNTRGGVFNEFGSDVQVVNSLVSNPGAADCSNPVQRSVASLERPAGGCGANLQGDPRLGPPGPNGGATPSRAPDPSGPAVDAADATSCLPDDQRFAARVQPCDLGAVEVSGVPGTAPVRDPNRTSQPTCAAAAAWRSLPRARTTVRAHGTLGEGRARASFDVSVRDGRMTRPLRYTDLKLKVKWRFTVLAITASSKGRSARVLGVAARTTGRGPGRCFVLTLQDGPRGDALTVRVAGEYRRAGRPRTGGIQIVPPLRLPGRPIADPPDS